MPDPVIHRDLPASELHPPGAVAASAPEGSHVKPGYAWFKTSDETVQVRNADDDDWIEQAKQSALTAHVGSGGTAHAAATVSTAGFLSTTDKTKLDAYPATPAGVITNGLPVTILVAATDSLHKTAVNPTYVCDGTADEVTIQAAINALPTAGGCVVLLEGTYTLADTISIDRSGVTLVGQGAGTTTLVFTANEAIEILTASDIHISALSITGPTTGSPPMAIAIGPTVQRAVITECRFVGNGITITNGGTEDDVAYCTIARNSFDQCQLGAVSIAGGMYLRITDNVLTECKAVNVSTGTLQVSDATYVELCRNTCSSTETFSAIGVSSSALTQQVEVQENTVLAGGALGGLILTPDAYRLPNSAPVNLLSAPAWMHSCIWDTTTITGVGTAASEFFNSASDAKRYGLGIHPTLFGGMCLYNDAGASIGSAHLFSMVISLHKSFAADALAIPILKVDDTVTLWTRRIDVLGSPVAHNNISGKLYRNKTELVAGIYAVHLLLDGVATKNAFELFVGDFFVTGMTFVRAAHQ